MKKTAVILVSISLLVFCATPAMAWPPGPVYKNVTEPTVEYISGGIIGRALEQTGMDMNQEGFVLVAIFDLPLIFGVGMGAMAISGFGLW